MNYSFHYSSWTSSLFVFNHPETHIILTSYIGPPRSVHEVFPGKLSWQQIYRTPKQLSPKEDNEREIRWTADIPILRWYGGTTGSRADLSGVSISELGDD